MYTIFKVQGADHKQVKKRTTDKQRTKQRNIFLVCIFIISVQLQFGIRSNIRFVTSELSLVLSVFYYVRQVSCILQQLSLPSVLILLDSESIFSCVPSLKVKPGGTRCIIIQKTADDVFKQAIKQQFLISKNYLSQRRLFL